MSPAIPLPTPDRAGPGRPSRVADATPAGSAGRTPGMARALGRIAAAWLLLAAIGLEAAEPVRVRIVAANLTGDRQRYEAPAERIFRALQPDLVAIQEFNRGGSQPAEIEAFVRDTFGPGFSWYREPSGSIPNGVISRWPLRAAGSWDDVRIPDRGFAWAQVDIPGPEDLYLVSVHLKAGASDASIRAEQALALRTLIRERFPAGALLVVAGDLNTHSRTEAALRHLGEIVEDRPVPADQSGNPNTNNGRSRPYDLILTSPRLTALSTPVALAGLGFPDGLVFDTRVFRGTEPLPVLATDSSGHQHMAVIKDFLLPVAPPPPGPAARLDPEHPPRLTWEAAPGEVWQVETSVNLSDWSPSGVVISGTSAYQYQPPAGLSDPFRVFRVRRLP